MENLTVIFGQDRGGHIAVKMMKLFKLYCQKPQKYYNENIQIIQNSMPLPCLGQEGAAGGKRAEHARGMPDRGVTAGRRILR